jgi:hypothetical protein
LNLVVSRVRIVDHVVTPQRYRDFVCVFGQVTHLIELLQAVLNVIEGVVGAVRLAVAANELIKDRNGH